MPYLKHQNRDTYQLVTDPLMIFQSGDDIIWAESSAELAAQIDQTIKASDDPSDDRYVWLVKAIVVPPKGTFKAVVEHFKTLKGCRSSEYFMIAGELSEAFKAKAAAFGCTIRPMAVHNGKPGYTYFSFDAHCYGGIRKLAEPRFTISNVWKMAREIHRKEQYAFEVKNNNDWVEVASYYFVIAKASRITKRPCLKLEEHRKVAKLWRKKRSIRLLELAQTNPQCLWLVQWLDKLAGLRVSSAETVQT